MAGTTVSTAGMRLLRLLVGNPPQTVADLIDATGVTRTAVAEQLNELLAAGFVEREIEKLSGRGRPHHIYKATDAVLLTLFPSTHSLLVPAIWRAVEEAGGEQLREDVLKRVAGILAHHYKRRINARAPEDRLRRMAHLLREEGGLVEVVKRNGQLVMRKRSCSFISMVDEKRSLCCVDQEMLVEVVGRPIRRTTYRHDGDPCCTFEIVADGEH